MTRWVALGLAVMACGGGAAGPFPVTKGDRSEALAVEDGGAPALEPHDAGLAAEPEPCFEISLSILERWPSVGAKMTAAAATWGFDMHEGPDCKIELLVDTSWRTPWSRTELVGDTAVVWINPEARIVEGPECSVDDGEVLLLSVLVHEFGHLAGLPHSDCTDCAMDEGHDPCVKLRPSAEELAAL